MRQSPSANKPKQPMTIIAGLIAEDSIILASDSQTTYGVPKDLQAKKVHIVSFKNADVLVGISGSAELANCVIERFQGKAENVEITDQFTVQELIQSCVRYVMDDIRAAQGRAYFEPRALNDYIQEKWKFEIVVGHYVWKKPIFHIINSDLCAANKQTSDWAASGVGADVGGFLLREYSNPKMAYFGAVTTAIYIVDKVTKYVAGCGGLTQVGALKMSADCQPRAHLVRPEDIAEIVSQLPEVDKETRDKYVSQVQTLLENFVEKRKMKIMEELQALEASEDEEENPDRQ